MYTLEESDSRQIVQIELQLYHKNNIIWLGRNFRNGDLMRVLVTGAGGYIGTVLTEMLLNEGFDVVALDRYFFGKELLPQDIRTDKIIEADIRTVERGVFNGVDAVIDLAAMSTAAVANLYPQTTFSVNHLGRLRMAVLSKSSGVGKYILASSCEIYGHTGEWADETSQTNAFTNYAQANLMAESDILALSDRNFSPTVIRQATVYGKSRRMRLDLVVNDLVTELFTNRKVVMTTGGKQYRPFVHVRDTSAAMIKILENDGKTNGQIYNIGSNEQNYQIIELAKEIAKSLGLDLVHEWKGVPDNRSYRVRFDKIRKDLGFSPKYDIARGSVEVWKALESGEFDPHDPKNITVDWYRLLTKNGVVI